MLRFLDKLAEVTAVIAFAVSSGFVFLNVLNRYLVLGLFRDLAKEYENLRPLYFSIRDVLSSIVVTADEVPGLLLVWVAFLGAYVAMRQDGHIAFTLFLEKLPDRLRLLINALNTLLICSFLVLVFRQSVRMISVSGRTEIETAAISQGWFMLILPVASILLLVAVVHRFISDAKYR